MKLDVKKVFQARSDRVKGIDIHPTEPWILTTMYSGRCQIWNYETQTVVKTIEVSTLPVRTGKFIARKNWIVTGSDDFNIRVYNYNTSEKVHQFEGHPDYIRVVAVHPTQPFLLTAADDMTIKLWNWEQNWKNTQVFEGHAHYIMYMAFNPKDPNTFASACLDRTVKIWSLGSSTPNFTLEAHESKGVNFVEYYPQSDKPYIITTSDDRTIKVWDYQTKSCVATMTDHSHNVSFAVFHPELPVIISGSEDSSIKVWNANTYKLEQTLNYGLERAWCAATKKGSNSVAIGFDDGHVVLQLGKEEPAISMDPKGRLIWSKHSEVFSSVVKGSEDIHDGEILPLTQKELGNVEVYPTQLVHSPNGQFVAVTGDGEYIIYTALAWRNKSFGSALDFAWAQDSNQYAVRESASSIKVFKNFKERPLGHINFGYNASLVFGGSLLGIKGDGFVAFFDWDSGKLVRRVDVEANQVVWSDSGELVAIIGEETFYVLKYDREAFQVALSEGNLSDEDGLEESFEVVQDISDTVRTGKWVGDCFIYTTFTNRLNYLVGSETYTISHFDKQMYLLGYIPRDNAIYLADKDVNVTSYNLSLAVVEYQTVVLRGDMDLAADLLETIPEGEKTKIARFLEAQGYTELALEVSKDPEHQFELAVSLNDLSKAEEIAKAINSQVKWKSLGDSALEQWNIRLAEKSFQEASDLESLVLIYTSTGNKPKLSEIAAQAIEQGKYNLAFNAYWFVGNTDGCIELLNKTARHSEAALFALTFGGDIEESTAKWREQLVKSGRAKSASSIANPKEDPSLFPENAGQKISVQPAMNGGVTDLIDVDTPGAEAVEVEESSEELKEAEEQQAEEQQAEEQQAEELEEQEAQEEEEETED
jgi:coatomer subunit beta'